MTQKKQTITLEVGTKALLQNQEGKFLFVQRAKPYYGEKKKSWDIPGGRINHGETQVEALQREIREETGLELSGLVGVLGVQDILKVPGKHIVRVTYLAICSDAKEVVLNKKEHSAYKWLSLDEVDALNLDSYLKPIVEKLRERFPKA
jgi:ADP-ribose pyrophosphatase YjhB (NUDIX family)